MNMVIIYPCQETPMLSLQQTLTTATHTENSYIGEIWDWGSPGFQTSIDCKFKASPSQASLSYKGRSHPTELKLREKAELGGPSL